MKSLIIIGLVILLAGCEQPAYPVANQCIRAELFKQCMAILPVGPVATHYNDWSEVVSECGSEAARQSMRKAEAVPMECRAQ